jgi:hypothetical protein
VQRGERARHVRLEGQLRRELRRLVGKRRRRLLALRLRGDLGEAAALAGQLLVEAGQRLLGRRVDEDLRHLVEELVAGRPLHGPVAAQPLARLEDLLDPHALDPRLA